MSEDTPGPSDKKTAQLSLIVILVIVAGVLVFSWVLTRGVDDNSANDPESKTSVEQPSQPNHAEPATPNTTGGSTGTGTGTSNDPSVPTPSPAGGVDTNQAPAY